MCLMSNDTSWISSFDISFRVAGHINIYNPVYVTSLRELPIWKYISNRTSWSPQCRAHSQDKLIPVLVSSIELKMEETFGNSTVIWKTKLWLSVLSAIERERAWEGEGDFTLCSVSKRRPWPSIFIAFALKTKQHGILTFTVLT